MLVCCCTARRRWWWTVLVPSARAGNRLVLHLALSHNFHTLRAIQLLRIYFMNDEGRNGNDETQWDDDIWRNLTQYYFSSGKKLPTPPAAIGTWIDHGSSMDQLHISLQYSLPTVQSKGYLASTSPPVSGCEESTQFWKREKWDDRIFQAIVLTVHDDTHCTYPFISEEVIWIVANHSVGTIVRPWIVCNAWRWRWNFGRDKNDFVRT